MMRDLQQDAINLALAALPILYDKCKDKAKFDISQEFIDARERYRRELAELDRDSYSTDN